MTRKEPDFTEATLSSKTVYRGKLLHVLEDEVRLPDGGAARREYIRHPGAAVMVPMPDPKSVVLVRQFRYALARHFYEIPAGKIDPGEAPLATARRELREECGFEAGEWRHLATIHPCIGYSDERIELYLAQPVNPRRARAGTGRIPGGADGEPRRGAALGQGRSDHRREDRHRPALGR